MAQNDEGDLLEEEASHLSIPGMAEESTDQQHQLDAKEGHESAPQKEEANIAGALSSYRAGHFVSALSQLHQFSQNVTLMYRRC